MKLGARSWLANDKSACGTHIHDLIVLQFFGENAGAEPSVPANIDASQENNQSHIGATHLQKINQCSPALPPGCYLLTKRLITKTLKFGLRIRPQRPERRGE